MTDDDGITVSAGSARPEISAATVGLTGGIGAGKSTAGAALRDLGARVFSADAAVHELYRRPEVRAALHARFGDAVVDTAGLIDRRALAALVAGDVAALEWLETLIHPRVAHEVHHLLAQAPAGSVVVCEVPLLFESGMQELFDLTVSIEAPGPVRRARNAGRMATDTWTLLEGRQLTSEARAGRADMVYVNDGDPAALKEFVAGVFERARGIARAKMRRMLGVTEGGS